MDARLVAYLGTLGTGPEALDGWTIQVAQRDGRDVGFFIHRGTEVHMLALEPGAMSRKNILDHLTPVFEQYGFCTTRVPLAEKDHKLRRILGFAPLWADHECTYWAMTKLPFTRKEPSCQSQ
jgi:hypothetical protein